MPIVLGCMSYGSDTWAKWVLNEDKALPLLKAAWDAGIQTWDTADMYSNVNPLISISRSERRLIEDRGFRNN
jgi:aryl-alcohol dehydrogenase-like predicted oxidoreductase